jgi:hypothetical protein
MRGPVMLHSGRLQQPRLPGTHGVGRFRFGCTAVTGTGGACRTGASTAFAGAVTVVCVTGARAARRSVDRRRTRCDRRTASRGRWARAGKALTPPPDACETGDVWGAPVGLNRPAMAARPQAARSAATTAATASRPRRRPTTRPATRPRGRSEARPRPRRAHAASATSGGDDPARWALSSSAANVTRRSSCARKSISDAGRWAALTVGAYPPGRHAERGCRATVRPFRRTAHNRPRRRDTCPRSRPLLPLRPLPLHELGALTPRRSMSGRPVGRQDRVHAAFPDRKSTRRKAVDSQRHDVADREPLTDLRSDFVCWTTDVSRSRAYRRTDGH